nr:putative ribonuclease H-like domain-containing protein [Tanacetum cinerariifolium]
SIFHTNSGELEGQPNYNRFASVEHMKAVPLPLTGNYMPPSNIPDIDESQMVYGKKAFDSSEIKTNDDSISHSHDFVLFDFSDRPSTPSTNDFQTCNSSQECSRPNHSDHDSNDSISNVSAPAREYRDTIVIDCARQEDFPSVCTSSIETDVKSSKTLCNKFGFFNKESYFRKHKSVTSKSCYVCGSYLHLIKDCNLHGQRLVKRNAKGNGILKSIPTRKPVNPNRPKPVSAGRPNPISADQPNPVSAGQPNIVSAGDGILGSGPLNIQSKSTYFHSFTHNNQQIFFPITHNSLYSLYLTGWLNEKTAVKPSAGWPWTIYGMLKTKGSKINGGSKFKSWSFAKGSKHIEIRHHFIRDANEKKLIQVLKIPTENNVADLLTKSFDVTRFSYLVVHIVVTGHFCWSGYNSLHFCWSCDFLLVASRFCWSQIIPAGSVFFLLQSSSGLDFTDAAIPAAGRVSAGGADPAAVVISGGGVDHADVVVSAGGADSAGTFISTGISVATGPSVSSAPSSPIRDPAKGKAVATPSSPRVAKEQEREIRASAAQSTLRQAELDRISLNLTNEEWIGLVDQVRANPTLSAELLRELMHWVGRADLMVLYGMVSDKYKLERATSIGLGLWSDLRTLITAREDRDASIIWDDQDQWEIRSWRFYAIPDIHVLETEAGDIMYMFVNKKYPILPATIQRMLNHGLEIDRDPSEYSVPVVSSSLLLLASHSCCQVFIYAGVLFMLLEYSVPAVSSSLLLLASITAVKQIVIVS